MPGVLDEEDVEAGEETWDCIGGVIIIWGLQTVLAMLSDIEAVLCTHLILPTYLRYLSRVWHLLELLCILTLLGLQVHFIC